MTKAVVTWRGGDETVEGADLGDPRVRDLLDRLAAIKARDVSIDFADDEPAEHEHEWLDISTVEQGPNTHFECRVEGCGMRRLAIGRDDQITLTSPAISASDACPLCGRADSHTHTSGPFGMT